MGQVTEKVRWYRCRNPYCKHEWSKSTQLTFSTSLNGSYYRDSSHCPKCGKKTDPHTVDVASYVPRREQEWKERTKIHWW